MHLQPFPLVVGLIDHHHGGLVKQVPSRPASERGEGYRRADNIEVKGIGQRDAIQRLGEIPNSKTPASPFPVFAH